MSLQGHYLCKFPALYIININRMVACAHRVALAALRGDQAASAESCTHPAKRDHRFPPPIAERQRLPNVRINEPRIYTAEVGKSVLDVAKINLNN